MRNKVRYKGVTRQQSLLQILIVIEGSLINHISYFRHNFSTNGYTKLNLRKIFQHSGNLSKKIYPVCANTILISSFKQVKPISDYNSFSLLSESRDMFEEQSWLDPTSSFREEHTAQGARRLPSPTAINREYT